MVETQAQVLLNLTETCRALEITEPTLRRWIADGCPVADRGSNGRPYGFDVAAVQAWRDGVIEQASAARAAREREIESAQSRLDLKGGETEGADALPLKIRREYYEAEAKRIALARQRGDLCDAVTVRVDCERVFRYLADRLQALPDQLERRCNLPPAAVAEVGRAVDEWQAELSKALQGALDDAA